MGEDRTQRILKEAEKNIAEGVPKILTAMADQFREVTQWDGEKLFAERVFLEMNGIDT